MRRIAALERSRPSRWCASRSPIAITLGQEFFRWEIATAVAGAIIGIDPFDQPDVEASKVKTRELTAAYENERRAAGRDAGLRGQRRHALHRRSKRQGAAAGRRQLLARHWLAAHFARMKRRRLLRASRLYRAQRGAYRRAAGHPHGLMRDRKHVATCLGFGPRFLHSTGQAYKGGPNSGVFLQITCDDAADLAFPGKCTFGIVKAAQARGDFQVLAERDRRVLRVISARTSRPA